MWCAVVCDKLELLHLLPLTDLVRGFVIHGVSMSVAMLGAETVEEIDEALRYLSLVPARNRGIAWQAFADALLERRTRLENTSER